VRLHSESFVVPRETIRAMDAAAPSKATQRVPRPTCSFLRASSSAARGQCSRTSTCLNPAFWC
jgi:hypothetical protein